MIPNIDLIKSQNINSLMAQPVTAIINGTMTITVDIPSNLLSNFKEQNVTYYWNKDEGKYISEHNEYLVNSDMPRSVEFNLKK